MQKSERPLSFVDICVSAKKVIFFVDMEGALLQRRRALGYIDIYRSQRKSDFNHLDLQIYQFS